MIPPAARLVLVARPGSDQPEGEIASLVTCRGKGVMCMTQFQRLGLAITCN